MPPKRYSESDKGRDIIIIGGTYEGREAWVMEDRANPTLFSSAKDRVNLILKPTSNNPEKASFTTFSNISFLPVGVRNSILHAVVKKKPKIGQLANMMVLEMSKLNISPSRNPDRARAVLDEMFTHMLEYWNQVDLANRRDTEIEFDSSIPAMLSTTNRAASQPIESNRRDRQAQMRSAVTSPLTNDPPAVATSHRQGYPGTVHIVPDSAAVVANSPPAAPNMRRNPAGRVHVIPYVDNDDHDMWSASLNSDLSAQINRLTDEINGQ